jgi:hypothetical protein
MRETYGSIDALTANVPDTTDVDAGEDENQITLYIDNPTDLSRDNVTVSLKSLNTAGTGGGGTVWATTRAKYKLDLPFGPTTAADEGLVLVASAPDTTKWRIEFLSDADVGAGAALGITWMAVCGRSDVSAYLAQKTHRADAILPAAGAWTDATDTPNQQGVQPYRFVNWSVIYTQGSATGAPKFRTIWTDSLGNEFEDTGANVALVQLAAPVGPTGTNKYTFASENLGDFDKVRLEAAESGDTANPGNLAIFVSARSNL